MEQKAGPIGVFDSGYGGLTVFREIAKRLPRYDYIYLGDNARVPYGNRSFETVYQYTLECVNHLFDMGCALIILACNTASAKALRAIQTRNLPQQGLHRVLGVIRPTTEVIGSYTRSGHVGIFATSGTVSSMSYNIELHKFFPEVKLFQEACPMWVPLVENNEHLGKGADYFIRKHVDQLLEQSPDIDTILLACTHYPLLIHKIREALPAHISLVAQGEIVATSLANYLSRHPEIDALCSKTGNQAFYTTESADDFNIKAKTFLDKEVSAKHLQL